MTSAAMIWLIVLGVFCLLGAVLVMRYAITFARPKPPAPEPLPGGGGWYLMQVEGLATDADKAKLESALQAAAAIRAEANPATGQVRIRYEGYPGLTMLDSLQAAAENAGFRVISIE